MGVNTIHDKTNDVISCYDETQKFFFKCELLGEKACRVLEVAKGLEMYAITMTVKINGKCNINEKDKIRIMGKHYLCITSSNTFDNPEVFRKRNDIDNFTGETVIGLQ